MKAYKQGNTYKIYKESNTGIYPVDKTVVNLRSGSQSLTLKAGTEGYIEIVGAGGRGGWYSDGWNYIGQSGGSGGRFSANFKVNSDVTLAFTCGTASSKDSYVNIGSTRIITGGGGEDRNPNSNWDVGRNGGVPSYSVPSQLTFTDIVSITGNRGGTAYNGAPANAASVASTGIYGQGGTGGYGDGNSGQENGWCYVHYTKEYITVDTYKAFNV